MLKAFGIAGLCFAWLATAVLADAVYDGATRTIRITCKDNTLRSIAQQVANPDIISYDYLGRMAVCRAHILITTGDMILEGETLQMDAAPTNRLIITVCPVGQLTVINSTISPVAESRGSVWGIDVNGSSGVLIANGSEFIGGGIHNGTGSSPKIVADNVVFRRCETALNVYFPPTTDSKFNHLTFQDGRGHAVVAVGRANLVFVNSSFSTNSPAFYLSKDGRVTTVNCTPVGNRAGDVLFDKGATAKAAWINKCCLKLNVVDQKSRPLAGAEVVLTDWDRPDLVELTGKTDAAGWLVQGTETNIPITMSVQTRTGREAKYPYRVKVAYQGKTREDTVSLENAGKDQPVQKTVIWKGE